MRRDHNIRYLSCSVVCHGECELILVKQIRMKNRIQIEDLSEKNGKNSIIINTINDYLSSHFPTKEAYIKKNRDCLKIENKKIVNHKIFSIMDKDDASDDLFSKYVNKNLFSQYWWGKEDYIFPIYFNPNMDEIFKKHGFKINVKEHKPAQYLKLLTIHYDEVISMLKKIDKKESNIKDFIDYIEMNK